MGLPEHEVGYGLRGGLWATKAVTYEGEAPLSESLVDGYDVVTENCLISNSVFPTDI